MWVRSCANISKYCHTANYLGPTAKNANSITTILALLLMSQFIREISHFFKSFPQNRKFSGG